MLYLCSLIHNSVNQMARPLKETPVLFGEEARLFEERMKNPPKESKIDRRRREANYHAALSMFV